MHRATLLPDGSVLITGGCTEPGCGGFEAGQTSELYVARTGFTAGPSMSAPRAGHTATLLADGRVLLVGGFPGEGEDPTAAAEIYDPSSNEFTAVGDLAVARADHSATLLGDGTVLIAGGVDGSLTALATTELFDPATAAFTAGPDLPTPRAGHVAGVVGDVVLLMGGTRSSTALRTTEVLSNGEWSAGPRLLSPRVKHGLALLADGRVLVVGGATDTEGRERLATTEIIDLANRDVVAGPELTQGEYKLDGAIAVLTDGRVVIPSGDGLDVFDPATGRMTHLSATTYDARSFRTVTPVGERQVLVAGGYDDAITPTDQAVVITIS